MTYDESPSPRRADNPEFNRQRQLHQLLTGGPLTATRCEELVELAARGDPHQAPLNQRLHDAMTPREREQVRCVWNVLMMMTWHDAFELIEQAAS